MKRKDKRDIIFILVWVILIAIACCSCCAKEKGTPASPKDVALGGCLYQEREVFSLPRINPLAVLHNIRAEYANHAVCLLNIVEFHPNYTSFPHLQASISHWQERCTNSRSATKKPNVQALGFVFFSEGEADGRMGISRKEMLISDVKRCKVRYYKSNRQANLEF